jgi:hypothetical protein
MWAPLWPWDSCSAVWAVPVTTTTSARKDRISTSWADEVCRAAIAHGQAASTPPQQGASVAPAA